MELKNGMVLEVRRGNETNLSPRRTWASLEEWKAQLPDGGATATATAAAAKRSEDGRIYIDVAECQGRRFVSNLYRQRTRDEHIRILTNRFENHKRYNGGKAAPCQQVRYNTWLESAKHYPTVRKYRVPPHKVAVRIRVPGTQSYRAVYYNKQDDMFGLANGRLARTLAELGFEGDPSSLEFLACNSWGDYTVYGPIGH